jgi:hypothetical protein
MVSEGIKQAQQACPLAKAISGFVTRGYLCAEMVVLFRGKPRRACLLAKSLLRLLRPWDGSHLKDAGNATSQDSLLLSSTRQAGRPCLLRPAGLRQCMKRRILDGFFELDLVGTQVERGSLGPAYSWQTGMRREPYRLPAFQFCRLCALFLLLHIGGWNNQRYCSKQQVETHPCVSKSLSFAIDCHCCIPANLNNLCGCLGPFLAVAAWRSPKRSYFHRALKVRTRPTAQ